MNIEKGGKVNNTKGSIASLPDSTGKVTVTGAGASWSNRDELWIGDNGNAILEIGNGGEVSNTIVTIGYASGSKGEVTVYGIGSTWKNDIMNVGFDGNGTLELSTGGSVSNASSGFIGANKNSTGAVSVKDAGSTWSNTGSLYVGYSGNGVLEISNGGRVSNTSSGFISANTESTGTVSVEGAGSTWNTGAFLLVGHSGNGTLTISNGGSVRNTSSGFIGTNTKSMGVASVEGNGSTWSSTGSLYVGYSGNGTLVISKGGRVSNTEGVIGVSGGNPTTDPGTGTVTVKDSGSTWYNNGSLVVGRTGSGTLTISNGGSVRNTSSGFVGANTNSIGVASVEGAGSTWNSSGSLYVGHSGNGTLTISNGGSVRNTSRGFVGTNTDGIGVASVEGAGSTWSNTSSLNVGHYGNGTLAISNDGQVSATGGLTLAAASGSAGTLVLSSGGILQTSILLAGAGSVTATFDGGILRAIADNTTLITGFAPGALILNSDGLIIDDNGHTIATDASAFSGTGGLVKTGSGSLTLGGANNYSGATTVMTGTLKAGGVGVFSADSVFSIAAGATLDLDGFDQSLVALVNSGNVEMGSASSFHAVGTTLSVTGNYESNGGNLTLRTVFGDDTSPSDRLVIGSATTGAGGATRLFVTNIGGPGDYTTGSGIQVVQVGTTSSSDAFMLGAPVTAGVYEYVLEQRADQSWYLVNEARVNPADDPKLYNPNIGSYLGNQYAAATMFAHNILDRRESVRFPDQTLWIRARYSALNTDLLDKRQHADIRSSVVQIGADLIRAGDIIAGIFGGYGHSSTDNRSNQTRTKADGHVNGTNIGLYGSWMPDEASGPYADVWGTYAWYDNKLGGQAQNRTTKYDSTGYTLSAEAGYGFTLDAESDGSAWILKPHAQISYVSIDADSFRDSHGTWYDDNQGSGVQSRLGARLHGQRAAGRIGISPFVELNWLYNAVDNSVRLDATRADSTIGRNIGELKAGLAGKISDSLSVWGHLGAQRGSEGFERYEVQLGLGWQW